MKNTKILKNLIAEIPDFPKPGVLFRDISPLLRTHFTETIDALSALCSSQEWQAIDLIAGIESRGFVFASALAYKQNKGFVKIRKPGKLPSVVGKVHYGLEYGESSLEMQAGDGSKILIVDDVLATGGSMEAAADLAVKVGYEVAGLLCLINLCQLNQFQWRQMQCRSLIDFE